MELEEGAILISVVPSMVVAPVKTDSPLTANSSVPIVAPPIANEVFAFNVVNVPAAGVAPPITVPSIAPPLISTFACVDRPVDVNVVNEPVLGVDAPIGVELIEVAVVAPRVVVLLDVNVVNAPVLAEDAPIGVELIEVAVVAPRVVTPLDVNVVNVPAAAELAPITVASILPPLISTVARVDKPLTPSVPPTARSVVTPLNVTSLENIEVPVTPSVLASDVAPFTVKVPCTVVAEPAPVELPIKVAEVPVVLILAVPFKVVVPSTITAPLKSESPFTVKSVPAVSAPPPTTAVARLDKPPTERSVPAPDNVTSLENVEVLETPSVPLTTVLPFVPSTEKRVTAPGVDCTRILPFVMVVLPVIPVTPAVSVPVVVLPVTARSLLTVNSAPAVAEPPPITAEGADQAPVLSVPVTFKSPETSAFPFTSSERPAPAFATVNVDNAELLLAETSPSTVNSVLATGVVPPITVRLVELPIVVCVLPVALILVAPRTVVVLAELPIFVPVALAPVLILVMPAIPVVPAMLAPPAETVRPPVVATNPLLAVIVPAVVEILPVETVNPPAISAPPFASSAPVSVVMPPTFRSVVAPLKVTSLENVEVPVTPSVPATAVLPVAPSTVNIFADALFFMVKSPSFVTSIFEGVVKPPVNVERPVTPSVVPTVALVVTDAEANVEAAAFKVPVVVFASVAVPPL